MECNTEIHNELIEMGDYHCIFCDQPLMEIDIKSYNMCCDTPDVIIDNGMKVCAKCGQVHGYEYVKEYVDFHENMYKIHRKSVYHRKYHIENVINKANINISRDKRERMYKVFDEVEKIVPLIDKNRKRMISINFIIRQLLKLYITDVPYKDVKITKSKKTLKYYNSYWKLIDDLIGDKIKKIIQK